MTQLGQDITHIASQQDDNIKALTSQAEYVENIAVQSDQAAQRIAPRISSLGQELVQLKQNLSLFKTSD